MALVSWLIGSRPYEKSPGLVLKSKMYTGSVLEDESGKRSRNAGNKTTTSRKNTNINCPTAKTLKLYNILEFIARSDIILRLDVRKEV